MVNYEYIWNRNICYQINYTIGLNDENSSPAEIYIYIIVVSGSNVVLSHVVNCVRFGSVNSRNLIFFPKIFLIDIATVTSCRLLVGCSSIRSIWVACFTLVRNLDFFVLDMLASFRQKYRY